MRKNNMRTPEEKERIVIRFLNGESAIKLANEFETDRHRIYNWVNKYQSEGLEGLKSKTGKHSSHHKNKGIHLRKPKNKIEELELELMKKEIEIATLKNVT